MLRVDNTTHTISGDLIFKEVSLTIRPGEITAIIGPSGVGKTTLLRLLALFQPPDSGTIYCNGTDVWTVSETDRLELRRNIGMVFQDAALFSASVYQNVSYGLRVRESWPARLRSRATGLVGQPDEIDTRVADALTLVDLEDHANQPAGSLSGGEAQRVAFARAVAYDPDIILLDEPTSDLDPRNTDLIENALRNAQDRGIGIGIATHDMHQARRIADQVAVMLGTSIVESGKTNEIFNNASNERTQQFITGELVY